MNNAIKTDDGQGGIKTTDIEHEYVTTQAITSAFQASMDAINSIKLDMPRTARRGRLMRTW